jgi:membrane associated rhomboid family serine protease
MQDEWWRVITAGLMHGGMIHLYFNSSALFSISSLLVGVCRMSWVVIVFTLSVVGGSLASIYGTIRSVPSVGASGGIMGLLGFLLVLSFFYKGGFPSFIKGAIIRSVILIAILGWVGSGFIDNAAHAGGFATGAVLGTVVAPLGDFLFGKKKTPLYIYPIAAAAAVVLVLGAIKVCRVLFGV